MTPAGIESVTFRFVAWHLNHCANRGPLFMLEHVRTLYTPSTSIQNMCSVRIFVIYLRVQDSDFLNYLLVDGSEGKTRVIGKESVSGTSSSFKVREGKTGLT